MRTHKTRAIEMLTRRGWLVGDVERKISRVVTKDLFGFADLIAIHPSLPAGNLLVQVTDATNVSKRLDKLLAEPNCLFVLKCGWRVEVWGIRNTVTKTGNLLKARTLFLSASTGDDIRVVNHSRTFLHHQEQFDVGSSR